MNAKKRMHGQKIYYPHLDEDLVHEQNQCLEVLYDFNHTRPGEQEKRTEIAKKLFAEVGDNCYIEPPLHACWGIHTHLGKNFYANFNLTLVDDTHIYIGDDVMIAPNVVITTAGHTLEPRLRRKKAQFNIPVTIEDNVWIGAGAIILPGVSIGKNSVVGAGSVVTKDIPDNVVAVGNPCKILREIGAHDEQYYYKNLRFDDADLPPN